MPTIFKIFGPPGTGKTTHLLTLLEHEFENIHPTECAYVSFTRKGTYEGVERAMEKFDLSSSDLKYFRTIHSLCFHSIGVRKHDMIQKEHYKQLGNALGFKFLGYYTEELSSNDDQYLFAEQLERNNPVLATVSEKNLNSKKLEWIKKNYRQFKKQLSVIDFTDLLELYLQKGSPLPVKVAFIDEAQDLTTLQWNVVLKMFSECERIYIAGDDDQAIYEWSGADVNRFLSIQGKNTVLSKSYRLPKVVHKYAHSISSSILTRQDKEFSHNGEEGSLLITTSWKDVNLNSNDPKLILSRNNIFLKEAEQFLEDSGIVYTNKGEISINPKIINALQMYEKFRKGEISDKEIAMYGAYFKQINKDIPWYDALNRNAKEVNYYRTLLALKTITSKSSVSLETIHSSKGSECDTVILMMDVTSSVYQNLSRSPDSELRCLYVGSTRARKNLIIKLQSGSHGFPNFHKEYSNENF